jgi:hypothetical protein
MSHDAVKAFYKKLSESSFLADSYNKLTNRWLLGYSEKKIVAFAASHGCEFTKSELAFIRLTNVVDPSPPGLKSIRSIDYFSDYEPTLHPQRPFSNRQFYDKHNRYVDGTTVNDKAGKAGKVVLSKPPKRRIAHQIHGGVCLRCGCSESFIASDNPSCK